MRVFVSLVLATSLSTICAVASHAQSAAQQPSDKERAFRIMLLQRSMGFGGIFGPMIAPLNKPGAGPKPCGHYSEYAACQAYRNGDQWAADRIQDKRSTPAERDWYGH